MTETEIDTQPTIDPARTALLVMDYQVGIIQRLDDPGALLQRMADAIDVARRQRMQVGYVRVAFEDADLESIPATSRMATLVASAGPAFRNDSPTTAIHDCLAPQPGDIVVRKTRVGAFSTTDLHEQLESLGITTLLLAGISTSGVVLSTVRDAHDRDYRVFILADATADPDPVVHDFLVEKIFPRQADMLTVAQLPALLSAD